jgi:hypothetical protein
MLKEEIFDRSRQPVSGADGNGKRHTVATVDDHAVVDLALMRGSRFYALDANYGVKNLEEPTVSPTTVIPAVGPFDKLAAIDACDFVG